MNQLRPHQNDSDSKDRRIGLKEFLVTVYTNKVRISFW